MIKYHSNTLQPARTNNQKYKQFTNTDAKSISSDANHTTRTNKITHHPLTETPKLKQNKQPEHQINHTQTIFKIYNKNQQHKQTDSSIKCKITKTRNQRPATSIPDLQS